MKRRNFFKSVVTSVLGLSFLSGSQVFSEESKKNVHIVDKNLCINCGVCIEACPEKAISLGETSAKIDPKKCTGCAKCTEVCPKEAIKPMSEKKSNVENSKE